MFLIIHTFICLLMYRILYDTIYPQRTENKSVFNSVNDKFIMLFISILTYSIYYMNHKQ